MVLIFIRRYFIMTLNKADILLPKYADMKKWSVVACDQYTSEPDYWTGVENIIGDSPSTYNLVLPEIYLENEDVEDRIKTVNNNMNSYISEGVFSCYDSSYIYVERTQRNGLVRKGIIAAVDLEDYDYNKGSKSAIRATEGTVAERIPPRLKVRLNAKLELPHVMLLIDDNKKRIIEHIGENKTSMKKVYDFDVMMDSGHLCGWLLTDELAKYLEMEIANLSDLSAFNSKYGVSEECPLVFAVGDGNHSRATAKEYYNIIKEKIGDKALSSPARYALAEIVNLHDDSLVFEAIHRVVFDVDISDFENKIKDACEPVADDVTDGQVFYLVADSSIRKYKIKNPSANLTVGSVQNFIDSYISQTGGRVDYIHSDEQMDFEMLKTLAGEGKLKAYHHNGFWQCMDTQRERQKLEAMCASGNMPWKLW
jgi:uncharacterized protein (DUF1015 family)